MKKVLDWIKFILCVAYALYIIINKDNYYGMVLFACPLVVIIGIIMAINKEDKWWLVLLIGICLSISFLLFRFNVIDLYEAVVFVLILTLLSVLASSLIAYFLKIKTSMNIHKMVVEAEIVDMIRNPNLEKEVYIPLLIYAVNEEEFEFNYVPSQFEKYSIGDKITAYINPNDYYDVYIPPVKKAIIKNVVGIVFIMIITIVILIDILV